MMISLKVLDRIICYFGYMLTDYLCFKQIPEHLLVLNNGQTRTD
jgi:hypothetical protein